jgi:hypothetical protein
LRLPLAVVAALALAACAPGQTTRQTTGPSRASGDVCVALFQQFDVLQRLYPNNQRRYADRAARPWVEAQAQRIRQAGCITLTRDLTDMEITEGQITDSGPAIAPVALHAGVVTSMQDDARARAFFASRGVPARSIGSAPLGRRIYLGPFATEGALDSARDLALRAGFIAPYPARS